MDRPVMIFGEVYKDIRDAAKELGVTISKKIGVYDIEIFMTINDLRVIKLQFVGLDRQARYAVAWTDELQTARQIIEYCRPDLLDIYDKTNPGGIWHPYEKALVNEEQSSLISEHQYANLIKSGRNDVPYTISNIGKMQRFKGQDKIKYMANLRVVYNKLGTLRTEYMYKLQEDIYFISGTRTFEKYLNSADWYILRDTVGEIRSVWPDVSKIELDRFAYGRIPNYGRTSYNPPTVRKDFYIYSGGRVYRLKERCGGGPFGVTANGWLIVETV